MTDQPLSMSQWTLLTSAAAHPDGLILPAGALRGGSFLRVIHVLVARGWAQTADTGTHVITDAGRARVGEPVPAPETRHEDRTQGIIFDYEAIARQTGYTVEQVKMFGIAYCQNHPAPETKDTFDPAAAAEAFGWDAEQGESEPPPSDGSPTSEDPVDEVPDAILEVSEAAPSAQPDEDGLVEGDNYGEADIPGTEDPPAPGLVFDHARCVWVEPVDGDDHPAIADVPAPTGASAPEGNDTPPAAAEANDSELVAPTDAPSEPPAHPTAVPAFLQDLTSRTDALEAFRAALITTGRTDAEAIAAAEWLDFTIAKALTQPAKKPRPKTVPVPRAPRQGTKQDLVITMLRRPEGATIAQIVAATGWAPHSCRGVLAGALKKKLGLTVVSEKPEGAERIYKIA